MVCGVRNLARLRLLQWLELLSLLQLVPPALLLLLRPLLVLLSLLLLRLLLGSPLLLLLGLVGVRMRWRLLPRAMLHRWTHHAVDRHLGLHVSFR